MKKLFTFILFVFICSNLVFAQATVLDTILNQISLDSLRLYVRQLSGETSCIIGGASYTIQSRHKLQPGNDKAAQYIFEKFQSFGITAQYETFSSTGANVIGTKTGTVFPSSYYIVCAHFDDMPSGTIAPGADDNASGTAAIIELARVLSKYNFQYTIKFIGFDEEEQGLVGSAYYATQAKARGDNILGVINLDMIAYDGNNDTKLNIHTKNVANSQQIGTDIVQNIAAYNIGLNPVIVASQPYSDHESFLAKGYGAVLVIEDNNDFNPYYHTVNDRITYFNLSYFHKMVKATGVTLAKYALNWKIVLEHTPIIFQSTETPIRIYLNIISGLQIGTGLAAPRLYYRVNNGSGFGEFISVIDTDGPVGFEYDFIIPPQLLGSTVEYYIAAQDQNAYNIETLPSGGSGFNPPGSNPPTQFNRFYVANQNVVFRDNCGNLNNWNSQSGWGTTTSTFVSKPASITDSPSGNYPNNTTNILTINNSILVPNGLAANLQFYAKWDLENGYDYVQLQISSNSGTTWLPIAGKYTKPGSGSFQPVGQPLYNGTQQTWVLENLEISSYLGKNILFRFFFKSDASINADGFYIDDFIINVYQSEGTIVTTSIQTVEGWNLVSIPLIVVDKRLGNLFPNAETQAYSFHSKYTLTDTLSIGSGYWVKFRNALNNNITGRVTPSFSVPVKRGWNLIGSLNSNISVQNITTIPSNLIQSPFIGYNAGYYNTDSLRIGNAYWLKVSTDGTINLNTQVPINSAVVFNKVFYENSLTFIDNSGKRVKLYLAEDLSPKYFDELPPLPPFGVFDVRFSNNKFVGSLKSENVAYIFSAEFPIQVLFESNKNILLKLITAEPDNEFTYNLTTTNPIYINQPIERIKIVSDILPTEFALEQNYPNPFNPTTTIRYYIPLETHVKLVVYDILGREIIKLVDGIQKEGSYSIDFSLPDKLSSGVFFYRLSAGALTSTKKMIISK